MHIGVYCACVRVYKKLTREQRRCSIPRIAAVALFYLLASDLVFRSGSLPIAEIDRL